MKESNPPRSRSRPRLAVFDYEDEFFQASSPLKVGSHIVSQKKTPHRQTGKRAQYEKHNENHADLAGARFVSPPPQRPGFRQPAARRRPRRNGPAPSPATTAVDCGAG